MAYSNRCTMQIVVVPDKPGCVQLVPRPRTHLDLAAFDPYRHSSSLSRLVTSSSKKAKSLSRSFSAKASDLGDRLQRARSIFSPRMPDLKEELAQEGERAKGEAFDSIMKAEIFEHASQFGPSEIPSLRPLMASKTGYAVDDGSRGCDPIWPLRVVNRNSCAVSCDTSRAYTEPFILTSSAELTVADDKLQTSNAGPAAMELSAQESLEPSELHDTPLLELGGEPMPFELMTDPIASQNSVIQPYPTNGDIYLQNTTGVSPSHLQVPIANFQLPSMNTQPRPYQSIVSVDMRKDRSRSMFLDTASGRELPAGLVAGVDASTEELLALYGEELPSLLEEVEELYKLLPYPTD